MCVRASVFVSLRMRMCAHLFFCIEELLLSFYVLNTLITERKQIHNALFIN